MTRSGWEWCLGCCGELRPDDPDTVSHKRFLHQVYTAVAPDYSGRVTVPALWDRKTGTLVSNESADHADYPGGPGSGPAP